MTKRKLERFAELNTLENVIQPTQEEYFHDNFIYKGKWANDYFGNRNPIVLELGCGKGEYSVGMAEKYPDKNFIGIDIKGERLWKGSKAALDKGLKNVIFIRTQIENINYFFNQNEISEIWLTFPDPQPNKPKIKKRLTSPQFIERYKIILNTEGVIHLKTDNASLFDYTIDVIKESEYNLIFETHNLYSENTTDDILLIKTYYEEIFIKEGKQICYLKFKPTK